MKERILILKPSSLGDIVHTLPALAALRRSFPAAHLSWAVNAEWVPVLEENPLLDAIRVFPRHRFRGLTGVWPFLRWLRHEPRKWQIDTVLDFQGLLRSGLIARATGAKRVLGLSDSREGARLFHSEVVDPGKAVHAVDRYLALAHAFGAEPGPVSFPLGPGEPIPAFPDEEKSFVVIHPFSRGKDKSLPPADVVAFCTALQPRRVVIVGRGKIAGIAWPANALDLLDRTTIPQLIWLLRRAAFTVSVDSGPMQLAAAVSPRVLGIHGWTDPRKVGPYPPDAFVWKGDGIVRVADLGAQDAAWFRRCALPSPAEIGGIAGHVERMLERENLG